MSSIGSLFSGAGGLDLAVESFFGGTVSWHCETYGSAVTVLNRRWPGVPNHGNVKTIDWSTVEPVDVLCGGFPCQDVSQSGLQVGMVKGSRSGLWAEFALAIQGLRPDTVVIENVRGLLTAKSSIRRVKAIDVILNDLATLGYGSRRMVLPASAVGAPHRRDRVFIVAKSGTTGHCNFMLRTLPTLPTLPTPTARDGKGAMNDPGRPPRADNGRVRTAGDDSLSDALLRLLPTPQAHDGRGAKTVEQIANDSHMPSNLNETVENILAYQGWGRYAPAVRRWESLTRPVPAAFVLNRYREPRLNPAFSEWMMGWPAGWVTALDIPRTVQLKLIGNGVVLQQAEAALEALTRKRTSADFR